MPKHIGIVACSAEGAALCYRTICAEGPFVLGEHMHPEISMHTHPLGVYMGPIRDGDWHEVGHLMISSARKLTEIGARLAICPDNTIHQAWEMVMAESPIPWIHIADAVAREARSLGFEKLGITGTKYLMNGPVYPEVLGQFDIDCETPGEAERERINEIIFTELVKGVFTERSRHYFNEVFAGLKMKGCDAVVMGCTEIPLLVDPADSPLPTLDSTRLLARAALAEAVRDD